MVTGAWVIAVRGRQAVLRSWGGRSGTYLYRLREMGRREVRARF